MLVLTRLKNEKIIITLEDGRKLIVGVAEIMKDRVRIGIEADKSITINREEVQLKLEKEMVNVE